MLGSNTVILKTLQQAKITKLKISASTTQNLLLYFPTCRLNVYLHSSKKKIVLQPTKHHNRLISCLCLHCWDFLFLQCYKTWTCPSLPRFSIWLELSWCCLLLQCPLLQSQIKEERLDRALNCESSVAV